MVFIGSRKELLRISSHFEDVWISFIHAFNRLENDQAQMEALLGQAEILRNEISKKNETIPDEKVKEILIGLRTILNTIYSQLGEMVENMPEMEELEFSHRKKNIKTEIKRAKGEITLCADALEEYEKTKDLKTPNVTPKLSRREFFRKTGSITKKGLALAIVSSTGLTTGIYTALLELSKNLPLKEDGLAILISYRTDFVWDTALKPVGKLFVPAYVARIEIAFGQKANIVKTAATSKDLFDVLHDKHIQNIVIFGHGTWNAWTATDREIKSKELNYSGWENDQKNGLFVRHTCGTDRVKKESGLLFDEKKSNALIKECEIINQKMKVLDKEIDFHLEFSKKNEYIILYWKNNDPNNSILSNHSLTTKLNDRYLFDHIKEKFMRLIKENFGLSPSFPIIAMKMIHLLNHLESYLKENTVQREDEMPCFGTPHYPPDRIRGWDRTSYPWEFMNDVFGDRKLDQMYAKK